MSRKTNSKDQVWPYTVIYPGQINFDEAETVAVVYNKFNRKVREALEIQKHGCHVSSGGMNPDKGQYVSTTFWMPLLKHLKNNGI